MNQQGGVSETLHGVGVADPWRWLENGEDPRVAEWEAFQRDPTRATLSHLPAPTMSTSVLAGTGSP